MKSIKESKKEDNDYGDIFLRYKFENIFNDSEKINKFDNMVEEYNRLINYRYSLYIMLSQKKVVYDAEEKIAGENYKVNLTKTKRMSVGDIIQIESEIKQLNVIISWIENFILGADNLLSKHQK